MARIGARFGFGVQVREERLIDWDTVVDFVQVHFGTALVLADHFVGC